MKRPTCAMRTLAFAAVSALVANDWSRRGPLHLTVDAYITSGLPPHKHQAWLKQMTSDICTSPLGDLSEEMVSQCPQLMNAWAQNPYLSWAEQQQLSSSTAEDISHGSECARAAEKILKRLVDERRAGNTNAIATTTAYNAVLDGWAKSGEKGAAAQRAEQILIEMHDAYVLGDENVQPDTQSFRSVILAWAKAVGEEKGGEEHAPHRAQRVLEWMINLYQSGDNTQAKPDIECFDTVLHAWSKSGHPDAPRKTEELIIWMERLQNEEVVDVRPRTRSFNAVLAAWSRSTQKCAPQRAEDILRHMKLHYDEGNEDLKPDVVSFSTVALSWAKCGRKDGPWRAERILRTMEEAYESGDTSFRPDVILYNHVIEALSKSDEKMSYKHALSVLERQIDLYRSGVRKCRPDVYSFTSVLGACASFSGTGKERMKAFLTAVSTFQELVESDYVTPNHVTYGTMMKATARLLPLKSHLRRKWTEKLFEMCSRDGCVGDMVLAWLGEATTPKHFKALTKGGKKENLPKEWTRNVTERHDIKKKKSRNNSRQKSSSQ